MSVVSSPTYSICDIIFAVAALAGSITAWVMKGHVGLVAAVGVAVGLCAIVDIYELRSASGHAPVPKDVSSLPQAPNLSWKWHAASLVLELAALFSQLICGWTVLCGMLLAFGFGGSNVLLHIRYYSGTAEENATTLLPTLSVFIMAVAMVMTAPTQGLGFRSVGLETHFGALGWLVFAALAGAGIAQASLFMMGVVPKTKDGERRPLLSASSHAQP